LIKGPNPNANNPIQAQSANAHCPDAVLDLAELRGPPLPENEWWESESDAELADLVLVAQPSDTSAPRRKTNQPEYCKHTSCDKTSLTMRDR